VKKPEPEWSEPEYVCAKTVHELARQLESRGEARVNWVKLSELEVAKIGVEMGVPLQEFKVSPSEGVWETFLEKDRAKTPAADEPVSYAKILGNAYAQLAAKAVAAAAAEARTPRIERPPGAGVLGLLGVLVSPRAMERVFGQTVADMRQECIEAIAGNKPWDYRGAWFRGHLSIAFTVVAFLTASVLKRVVEIWKAV
jgi:hypothetical protein